VGLGHTWLRPALDLLERRVAGCADDGESARILASLSPETPVLHPCKRLDCDPSRCNVG
jgi:hypothetical protein